MSTHLIILQPLLGAVGWTLLHFVWQGFVIGAVYAATIRAFAHQSAESRYAVSLGFLGLLALCPIVTLGVLWPEGAPASVPALSDPVAGLLPGAVIPGAEATADQLLVQLGRLAPWIVVVWSCGVALLTARIILDWYAVQRLVRAASRPADESWNRLLEGLARRLGIGRGVQLLESLQVQVPIVVGWLQPVVLVPTSVLMGLDPRQLELILIHELAHIRRYDYLVNLAQIVVETLLFYHPVVRWISQRVRQERENCCDDLVLDLSRNKMGYARALLELEGLRSFGETAAVASTGGHLRGRIHRIVGAPVPQRGAVDWMATLALAAFGATAVGIARFETPEPLPPSAPVVELEFLRPSVQAFEPPVPAHGKGPQLEQMTELGPVPEAAPASPVPQAGRPEARPIRVATDQLDFKGAGDVPSVAQEIDIPPPEARPDGATAMLTPSESTGSTRQLLHEQLADAGSPGMADIPAPTLAPSLGSATVGPAGAGPAVSGPLVSGGEPLRLVPPEFPSIARYRGIDGYAVVSFTVDRSGRPRDLRIVDAEPRGVFDDAVMHAVQRWRFAPLLVDGERVERQLEQRFQFDLAQGDPGPAQRDCGRFTGTRICR